MAYSRRRAGARSARTAVSRTRRSSARSSRTRSTARRSGGARAQTVRLVIQTTPWGGSDPFSAPAPAPRQAKH